MANVKREYDYLIVGAGLFGAVFAYEAVQVGKSVLVLERREHIAGNVYSKEMEGIQVHMYGPHIFHTDNRMIWEYANQFAEFNHFRYEPVANYCGELYNLPFNMNTFYQLWGVKTPEEAAAKIQEQRGSLVHEPRNLEEQAIQLVGTDIYEKLIRSYTEKQWGRKCSELPAHIIKRLPVRFRFDNNYFNHPYQGIPVGGYTAMVEKMLSNWEVRLNCDYLKSREEYRRLADTIIFTGPLDEYFDYRYGALQYRSLRFETEVLDCANYQGVAGVNYTDSETPYTRIVEHKHFELLQNEKTVITREYSSEWKPGAEAYYPVNDESNMALYEKYRALSEQEPDVYFGGRLGEYRYYDMDQTIMSALKLAHVLL